MQLFILFSEINGIHFFMYIGITGKVINLEELLAEMPPCSTVKSAFVRGNHNAETYSCEDTVVDHISGCQDQATTSHSLVAIKQSSHDHI